MNPNNDLATWFDIDLATQTVIPLSDLPDHAPRRGGRKIHKATPYRWARGHKAKDGRIVSLPTIQVAGTLCTSLEAFQAFCDRLTCKGPGSLRQISSGAGRKTAERASRELDRRWGK